MTGFHFMISPRWRDLITVSTKLLKEAYSAEEPAEHGAKQKSAAAFKGGFVELDRHLHAPRGVEAVFLADFATTGAVLMSTTPRMRRSMSGFAASANTINISRSAAA